MRNYRLAVALGFALSAAFIPAWAAPVTQADIDNDAKTPGDVLSSGLGNDLQRYSPLAKINPKTIGDLVPAWSFSFGGEKMRGQQSQAVVSNGKLIVTGSYSRAFAVDSKTGKKLWEYDHKLPEGIMPCCDVVNRGGALFDNLFIFGTLDAQLVALDVETGKVVWKETIADYHEGNSYTAAPLIAKGMVITGTAGGEFGNVGKIDARDAKTGRLLWTRPLPEGHMGYKFDASGNKTENGMTGTLNATWPGDLWKTGGVNAWMGCGYDTKLGLAYCGTGNPAPWNAYMRPGDNLYSCSTVAINVTTGKIEWHYQLTPHDQWDYDAMTIVSVIDYKGTDGKVVRATAKADKNGFFYVNDAKTGKLLAAHPFVKKITWATGIDMKTGRPILVPGNEPGDPSKSADGKKGTVVFAAPSFLGGNNQQEQAYSPKTGLFYIPANEWGMDIWNEPVTYKKGAAYLGAGFTIKPVFDDYLGVMRAFDAATGKIVWEVKDPAPLWGGALVTGDLVFWGTADGTLKAADTKTGKVLWQFQTGSGIIAPPITWEQDGEQYVGVASGWGGAVPLWGGEVAKRTSGLNQGGSYWAFKLHKPAKVAAN